MFSTTCLHSQQQLLDTLVQQIRRMERSQSRPSAPSGRAARRGTSCLSQPNSPLQEARESPTSDPLQLASLRSTGIPALDQLLAERGLPTGCLMEWLEPGMGAGVDTLALWGAVRSRRPKELLIVIDSRGDFYAPGAVALGLDPSTTVVIRPRKPSEVLWTLEQSLRTVGVGVVVCPWRQLSSRTFRRLQLAAEKGSSLGVLLRPLRARGDPSFAEVRWGVHALPSNQNGARRWSVELWRARRQTTGGSVELELCDDDGRLHLVPAVGSATRIVETDRA